MARYVRVLNQTRSSSLAERCRVASSLLDRLVGLLATPHLAPGDGLLIEHGQSIHTWFMRYPIDVAFIDRERRVTKTVEALRPWRMVAWAAGARDCVELPVGALRASGTQPGDILSVRDDRSPDDPTAAPASAPEP